MKQAYRVASIGRINRGIPSPGFFGARHDATALIILALFVSFVLSIRKYDLAGVAAFAAFPLFLVVAARLPAKVLLVRLALLSPFVLIMAAANPVLDRSEFLRLSGISISSGMVSGTVIVGKSMVTIAAVLSFSFCVPFHRICRALRGFRVPEVFVTQLALLYRYSFLLVEEAMALQKARNLRSFGKGGKDLSTTAKLIGALLLRTTDRAQRVYRGMVARGFSGGLTMAHPASLDYRDWAAIGIALTSFAVVRTVF